MDVDIVEFISNIKAEPSIWDFSKEIYTNRAEKRNAWDRVLKKSYPHYEENAPGIRDALAKHMQRKWKSLRDSFSRELLRKNWRKCGRKQYVYFDQLLFLQQAKRKASQSKSDNNDKFNNFEETTQATEKNIENNIEHLENCTFHNKLRFLRKAKGKASQSKSSIDEKFNNFDETTQTTEKSIENNIEHFDDCTEEATEKCIADSENFQKSKTRQIKEASLEDIKNFEASTTQVEENISKNNRYSIQRVKRVKKRKSKFKKSFKQSEAVLSILKKLIKNETVEQAKDNDPDTMFIMSLVPELKKIPDNIKLEVKCELLKVFKKAKYQFQQPGQP